MYLDQLEPKDEHDGRPQGHESLGSSREQRPQQADGPVPN